MVKTTIPTFALRAKFLVNQKARWLEMTDLLPQFARHTKG
jgi:hypothetical protein